jgi:hypothetical protein
MIDAGAQLRARRRGLFSLTGAVAFVRQEPIKSIEQLFHRTRLPAPRDSY